MKLAEEQEAARQLDEKNRQREWNWSNLTRKVGPRHAACRLDNFQVGTDEPNAGKRREALAKVSDFAADIEANVTAGRNLILWGPCGTGKDHLAIGLLHKAATAYLTVDWISGLELFGRVRDSINSETTEEQFFREFTKADVLLISDPQPAFGELTQFQATALFRIIDMRWRHFKPTWVTANFEASGDAANKIGAQVIDRLRHGALTIHCNWPSYRTPIGK